MLDRRSTTRAHLVKTAAAVLVENGALQMSDVARRAGVSIGLAYHHFGSKAGLLAAVVEDFYDRYDAAVIEVNPRPRATWRERERDRTQAMVRFFYADALAPVVLFKMSREPDVAAAETRRLERHMALAADNIAQGQARRELPATTDPDLAAAMIMGGLRQAVGRALARDPRPTAAELSRALWAFILGVVTAPAQRSSSSREE